MMRIAVDLCTVCTLRHDHAAQASDGYIQPRAIVWPMSTCAVHCVCGVCTYPAHVFITVLNMKSGLTEQPLLRRPIHLHGANSGKICVFEASKGSFRVDLCLRVYHANYVCSVYTLLSVWVVLNIGFGDFRQTRHLRASKRQFWEILLNPPSSRSTPVLAIMCARCAGN
jgi:hypothetical protein